MIRFTGLEITPELAAQAGAMFARKQQYVDRTVIEKMEPYTPKLTGTQIDIGASGTSPGTGIVQYNSTIARRNYYTNKGTGKEGTDSKFGAHGLRGKFWFERMKADHKDEILKGAKKVK